MASVAVFIGCPKQSEQKLKHENVALRQKVDTASMYDEIIGTSSALQKVLSLVSKVAPTDTTVMVTGETGTGKELIARAIHRRCRRASRVFIGVNCAAIPRDLIASELFGHEKGAFTGAARSFSMKLESFPSRPRSLFCVSFRNMSLSVSAELGPSKRIPA